MKNILLYCLLVLLVNTAQAQAVSWELSAETGSQPSNPATMQGVNFNNCALTRGSGLTASAGAGSMNSSGWYSGTTATTLADAIAANDFYEFQINTINCFFFNPTTIRIVLRSSATGPGLATLRCSSDGFTADIGTVTVGTTSTEFTFSETLSPNSSSITYRLYGYGGAAGGGTPSSGGTMRIGSSVTTTDNDLQLFATTTALNVSQVSNITVNDGDLVPATVFTANVPGATVNWSRTSENIGLAGAAGAGNLPAFTASNNTGAPVTSTVTVNATLGACTGPDMTFTITVNPAPCTITVNFSGNADPCNDNNTPSDPSDDFYTHNVQATFFNRPFTGNLQIVPGGDAIGTYSIPVSQIVGNQHIFTDVQLKADGTPTVIQLNFTDDPGCIDEASRAAVQPCSNASSCEVIGYSFANIDPCNNNGTPSNPADDFFTVDVDVIYSNSFSGATIELSGPDVMLPASTAAAIGTNLTATMPNVRLRADGQITDFSGAIENSGGVSQCSLPGTGPAVGSCSSAPPACAITDLELVNLEPCDDNGTPDDPTDDFYIADVLVSFVNPPATGFLSVSGADLVDGPFQVTIANVISIGSPFGFSNIKFRADGQSTSILVEFTAASGCIASLSTSSGIGPCSFPAPVLTCPPAVTVSCAGNVAAPNPASVSETHSCPGNVTITNFPADAISNQTCPNRFTITRSYTATDACGNSASCSQVITVDDPTPPTMTCPPNVTVACAGNVAAANSASVTGVSDNCGGAVNVFNFPSDVISNQTCANRFTIARSYFAVDVCGNSNNCIQTITVNDQTPPALTCPAGQTVSCAENLPASNIALVTPVSDNCGGTPTVAFVNEVIGNQTCVNRFTVTRTYRATDACGNSATCSQVITVNDQTPPVFASVPANTTVDCYVVPGVGIATATDNCNAGAATVAFLGEVRTPGLCPIFYTLTRTWRATDGCGNSATASQVVTVTDTQAPQFLVLPANTVVECGPNNAAEFQTFLDANGGAVVEDCAQIVFSQADSPFQHNAYNCGGTFRKNIRFFATDECGNTSFHDASFTVVDLTPPVFTVAPQNVEIECDALDNNGAPSFYDWLDSNGGLVAADACGEMVLEKALLSETQGCGNTWQKTYEFRVRDQCGNLSTATATFAVVDHTPPTLTCPPNGGVPLTCLEDLPAADPSASAASDCSGVTMTLLDSWTNGTGCPDWPMTVAYRYVATDACGNQAICEQAFTVEETETPTIAYPDTIELVCVDDIPGPRQLFAYIKNQLTGDCAGGFSGIGIVDDSGRPQNGVAHRSYTFIAKNRCGLLTSPSVITFVATGACNQLCTAPQGEWGDPAGHIGSMNTGDAIDQLVQAYGPPTAGGGNHTLSAPDAACVQEMLFSAGNIGFLPVGHHGCPLPASLANPDGSLNNQLAANVLALQLNIWYNRAFNDRDLGVQEFAYLPPCLVEYPLLKDLGQNASVQDLLDRANLYLQGYVGSFSADMPGLLNAALDNLNYFRQGCALNAPCETPPPTQNRSAAPDVFRTPRLFPNPATDAVILQFWAETPGNCRLTVTDVRGQQSEHILSAVRGLNTVDLPLNKLPAGVYQVGVQCGARFDTVRLVKIQE